MLACAIAEYFRDRGLSEIEVVIATGMALGASDSETALALTMKESSVRCRRSRLRARNEAVSATFPVEPLPPDLNRTPPH